MRFLNTVAVSAPLFSCLVAAVPQHGHHHLHRRDGGDDIVTEEVVQTIEVTSTVFVYPTDGPDSQAYNAAVEPAPAPVAAPNAAPYAAPVPAAPAPPPPGPAPVAPAPPPPAPAPPPPAPAPPPPAPAPPPPAPAPPPPAPAPPPPAPAPPPPAPAPGPASASGPSNGQKFTGDGTFYNGYGVAGCCGFPINDGDMVVAVAAATMGDKANDNPNCNKQIVIEFEGKQTLAKIADKCGGCQGADIDMTPAVFKAVAPNGDGRVHGVNWWFA